MDFIPWNDLTEWLKDVLIKVLNLLIEQFAKFLKKIISLLPNHDWNPDVSGTIPSQVIEAINWVFPVGFALDCIAFYTTALIMYFTWRVLLKWL